MRGGTIDDEDYDDTEAEPTPATQATIHFFPPFLLSPRANMKALLLDSVSPGSVGKANRTGWMTEEMFAEWFSHFISVVQPQSTFQPVILLVDGHCSHTRNVEVLQKAKTNNVVISVFPSHCTHRLQPCGVSFFRSLKACGVNSRLQAV